jgi:hypothetical protein
MKLKAHTWKGRNTSRNQANQFPLPQISKALHSQVSSTKDPGPYKSHNRLSEYFVQIFFTLWGMIGRHRYEEKRKKKGSKLDLCAVIVNYSPLFLPIHSNYCINFASTLQYDGLGLETNESSLN